MSPARSWKSGDGVSDQFPAGLRVLVVDDDTTCLRILEKMLTTCLYDVTKCSRAEVALKTLRDKKDGFDVVISDVHMPDMDGFKLLEHIGLEMDLPVIMMSADDSQKVVMKGVKHGACDYLIKPVRMEALKNIWQHVVRRKRHEWEDKDNEQSGSAGDGERLQNKQSEDDSSSANEGSWKSSKKRKDEDDEGEERDDSSSTKKPRVVWNPELHQQFVTAVNQLGIDKAVPKKILELMNIPGITRENVASHLQKYRQYLKKLSNGLENSSVGYRDPNVGSLTSLSGLDYRPYSSSVQLPPQNLATNKPLMSSVGPGNPRNMFTYEDPKIRFVEGHQHNNNNKRVNLLNGTSMEPRVYGNMNMPVHTRSTPFQTQMVQQQQPRTQFLNDVASHIPSAVFGHNGIAAPEYASSDFSTNQGIDFPGSMFSNSGMELIPEMNGSRGFPNYDVYNDLIQNNRTDDWGMQSVGSNFEHSNSSNGDDLLRMKLPEMGIQNGLYLDHQFGGEDLMSALLKQSQEGPLPLDGEFSFDQFQLDPV